MAEAFTDDRQASIHKMMLSTLFFWLLGFYMLVMGGIGLISGAAFIGIGIAILIWHLYYAKRIVLTWDPSGLHLSQETRMRGRSTSFYRWEDIVDTQYYAMLHQTRNGRRGVVHFFEIFTAEGLLFRARNEESMYLSGLIDILNTWTPHLSFIWVRGDVQGSYDEFYKVSRPTPTTAKDRTTAGVRGTAP